MRPLLLSALAGLFLIATSAPGATPVAEPIARPTPIGVLSPTPGQATVAAPLPWAEAADVGVSADGLARIAPAMQRFVDGGRVSGVVTLVARRGKLVHWDAVGYKNVESREPMVRDDIFRIMSMTKPVTSVAIMQLVEEGGLALDDPVAAYLPEFGDVTVLTDDGPVAPERPVTIADLLSHTSGLTYGIFGTTEVDAAYREADVFSSDLANLVDEVTAIPLLAHPGTRWNYSVSTDVLGRIVEVVSGELFDEYLRAEIFEPLGMDDTGFTVPRDRQDRLTTLYRHGGDGELLATRAGFGINTEARPELPSGGAGLMSTAADYVRFAQMLLNGGTLEEVQILEPATVSQMRTNRLPPELVPIGFGPQRVAGYGFGLGFSVLVDEDATPVPDNNGVYRWLGYASTYFWIDPSEELIGLVMTQLTPPSARMLEPTFQTIVYEAMQ